MTEQPFELTKEVVARLIADQFPDLAGHVVTKFGAGEDHWLFSIGRDQIARFPQRPERVAWLIREIEIVSIARDSLSSRVPHFEHVGQPTKDFPYPFVIYRVLPGVGADKSRVRELKGLAEDIGHLLGNLHRIDATRIPPTPGGWEMPPWGKLRTDLVSVADTVRPLLPTELRKRAEPYLSGSVVEPAQSGPTSFIHNDICPNHLIVNPYTGRLVGLIDFTDAMVGEVVFDFVGLIGIDGYGFIDQVAHHYDLPRGEQFESKLEWLARTLTLRWLAKAAINGSGDVSKHLSWVRYAFNN